MEAAARSWDRRPTFRDTQLGRRELPPLDATSIPGARLGAGPATGPTPATLRPCRTVAANRSPARSAAGLAARSGPARRRKARVRRRHRPLAHHDYVHAATSSPEGDASAGCTIGGRPRRALRSSAAAESTGPATAQATGSPRLRSRGDLVGRGRRIGRLRDRRQSLQGEQGQRGG